MCTTSPPPPGEPRAHEARWFDATGEECEITQKGVRDARAKVDALPEDKHAGVLKGQDCFGVRVKKEHYEEVANNLFKPDEAQRRIKHVSSEPYVVSGIPEALDCEEVLEHIQFELPMWDAWFEREFAPKDGVKRMKVRAMSPPQGAGTPPTFT